MSKPAAGDYYIFSRLLSPTGEKLAVTSNGQDQAMTLEPLANLATQKWTLVNYTDGVSQSVSPLGDLTLQVGSVRPFIIVMKATGLILWIRGGNDEPYTVYFSNNHPSHWSVAEVTVGTKVRCEENEDQYKEWILQAV